MFTKILRGMSKSPQNLLWTSYASEFIVFSLIKGQEISEENDGVFNAPKKSLISALASRKWSNQKIKCLYYVK